jgi:hypothetical protein
MIPSLPPIATSQLLRDVPPFDPAQGITIFEPEGRGPGYWVGCPGILYDAARDSYLLTYRRRRPRGDGSERGYQCGIAESRDGLSFTPIWTLNKTALGTSSMERFCLLPLSDGRYLLYISYVDPADNRWRIDVLQADQPEHFTVTQAQPLLTAKDTGTEGIKDPIVVRIGPAYYLFASYAQSRAFTPNERSLAHATADIYTTGLTVCPTGVAISHDGLHYHWLGEAFSTGQGWDCYQSRLTSVIQLAPGGAFVGFYDGSASAKENYEERAGLALSFDLKHWDRITWDAPWVAAPHSSGAVRYLSALQVGDELWLYYEYVRPDGSHELRHARLAQQDSALGAGEQPR